MNNEFYVWSLLVIIYIYNSVTVTSNSLGRGSIACPPVSPNLTLLEDCITLSKNGPAFLFVSGCYWFYGNMLGILNPSIIMGRKSDVTFPGANGI